MATYLRQGVILVQRPAAPGVTVLPGLHTWWLAFAAWLLTAWAAWRWWTHHGSEKTPHDSRPAKVPEWTKPDWIDVAIDTIVVRAERNSETAVSIQLTLRNAGPWLARLTFYLGDADPYGGALMRFIPAAGEDEVVRREIRTDAPGIPPLIHPPIAVARGGSRIGTVCFFHPSRAALPLRALIVEDTVSATTWLVPIDSAFARAVADNPTRSLIWTAGHTSFVKSVPFRPAIALTAGQSPAVRVGLVAGF